MAHEWYVIQTLSGQEQKVEKSLARRIGDEEMAEYIKEVLVPMEKVVEVRAGKKTTTQRKLYPGYMFMEVNLYDDEGRIHAAPWDFINGTQGIIGFVGGGGIGYLLNQRLRSFSYHQAGTALWAIVLVVWLLDFFSAEL